MVAPTSSPAAHEQEPVCDDDAAVTLSVNRALWGEVSDKLRAVQFSRDGRAVDLRLLFDGDLDEADRDSAADIAGEVMADFPDLVIREHVLTDGEIERRPEWRTVFVRRGQAA